MKSPFQSHDVTVSDRLARLRTFSAVECKTAVALHDCGDLKLQRSVITALESRLRRLAKARDGKHGRLS